MAGLQGEIYEWIREQESWKQDLFLRAAAAPELKPGDAEAVAEFLLGKQVEGAGPREVTRESLPAAKGGEQPMAIERIHELENVNKLDDGQTLAFAPAGVNVIWGANGAGKTGYSRILKHAGRTLDNETVLGNITGEKRGGPKATIRVKVGSERHELRLDLRDPAPAILGRICIADAKAGEVYLTKETEVDYVPITLSSLSRLVDGLGEVKAVLQERLERLDLAPIDPRPYGKTEVGTLIAGLEARTSEGVVIAAATLDGPTKKRHLELRRRVAEIDAKRAPELRKAAEADVAAATELAADLEFLSGALDEGALLAARERSERLSAAKEASRLAAERFEGEPYEGVGDDPWRILWEAARKFAHAQHRDLPPDNDPAHCPLCMQELGPEAIERLRGFERFVAEDVSLRLREAEAAMTEATRSLPDAAAFKLRHAAMLEKLGMRVGRPGKVIADWLDIAVASLAKLRVGEIDGLLPIKQRIDLAPWIAARLEEAKAQAKIERGEENEALRHELAELDARQLLAERKDEVLAHLAARREAERFEEAKAKTAANAASAKIRSLSQALIKKGLEDALEKQLDALNFQGLEVVPKTRTVQGKPMTSLAFKTVEGVPLTDVFSGGEQRRLGLAMFLAEMEVLADSSPIVFDDPSSSVDQEGRRQIARAIGRLGRHRQVVVFTHEFSFVHELRLRTPEDVPLELQHVCRLGETAGHVRPHVPWEGLPAGERVSPMREMLVGVRRAEKVGDSAREVRELCLYLRESCERTVEDRILAGVVTRRDDEVHTKKLDKLIADPEIADFVERVMSETSEWLHAKPAADGSLPFTSSELEEAINRYAELQKRITMIEGTREDDARRRRKGKIKTVKAEVTGRALAADERNMDAA